MRCRLACRHELPMPSDDLRRAGAGVEIQDFLEPSVLDAPDDTILSSWLRRLPEDLPRSVHGPFLDMAPASPDPRMAAVTELRYRQAIVVAGRLTADHLVLHGQLFPHLIRLSGDGLVHRQVPWWGPLLDLAEATGVTIVLENVFDEDPEPLCSLVEALDRPSLGLCLDVGHALAAGGAPPAAWIRRAGARLRYVHLHGTRTIGGPHEAPPDDLVRVVGTLLRESPAEPVLTLEYEPPGDPVTELARIRRLMREGAR